MQYIIYLKRKIISRFGWAKKFDLYKTRIMNTYKGFSIKWANTSVIPNKDVYFLIKAYNS